ncbi:MAG TPA: phage tail sheath subtilisin-like domain-containing protein [Kouleothrix sp.]|uniref:phage tail sheath C-terminal domain-containing protein n=1 Tax=Kouleothrix sp. TaxID=2779161 RepID=UPI002CBCFEDA|nr:phage tail sheath subtilisin-like domain-containing protein [Kouleothrix sp.]HRC75714.1 phage tail sheath subtilisin-like domain-containing protein [Kouleothrix sp.]
MPVTPTYPGVYIQELASDVRTIVPVDTATTAFLGRALRGPVNQPATIFSFEEFEQQFGGLWIESKLGFAVRDFFLNGGSKAIIVRVFNPSASGNPRATLSAFSATTPPADAVTLYHSLRERPTVTSLAAAADEALALATKAKAAALDSDLEAKTAAADAAKRAKDAADAIKAAADAAQQAAQQAVTAAAANVTPEQSKALALAKREAALAKASADKAGAALALANASKALAQATKDAGANPPAPALTAAVTTQQTAFNKLKTDASAALEAAKGELQTKQQAVDAAGSGATAAQTQALADATEAVATAQAVLDTLSASPADDSTAAVQRQATAQEALTAAGDDANKKPAAQAALKLATDAAKAAADSADAAGKIASAKQAIDDATARLATVGAVVKAVKDAAGKGNASPADVLTAAQGAISAQATSTKTISLRARSPGAWGNRLAARITKVDDDVRDQLAAQYDVLPGELFTLTVRDTRTGDEEVYPNVTFGPGQRQLHKVLGQQSSLVVATGDPPDAPALYAASSLPSGKLKWWDDSSTGSLVAAADAANDGEALTIPVILGTDRDDPPEGAPVDSDDQAITRGIRALDQADLFNMLCIPPYDSSDSVSSDVLAEAVAYCEKRRAMLIVDPPAEWTKYQDAKLPISGVAPSANAAIFFPRIRKRNPLRDNQTENFVPCGAVAGVMARTDFRRGVWKAAAGLEATLNGVEGFAVAIDDNANGVLNPLGINCLRVMPAAGPVVWGARTTVGDDRLANQWKYIPVRRMALWIEETLYRNTQWAVFEPNDEPLWSSLRLNIGNFMNGLFRQGAFQGKSPADAYFVRCDASTTTQTDIDRGIVNVIVGFAPLKPAEFVIISIKQITNQGGA